MLKDGGTVYLAEFHPLTELLGEDGKSLEHDFPADHPRIPLMYSIRAIKSA